MKRLILFLLLTAMVGATSYGGSGKKIPILPEEPLIETSVHHDVPFKPAPVDWSSMTTPTGTFTTLTGFYDYQSNGGAIQYIRVNPTNGNIHVTYMLAEDSTAAGLNDSRRTGYAFSSNGGVTWNNFNNTRVPLRRSGFPTMDLLKGPYDGMPVIANHSTIIGTQSTIFIDSPEGSGQFSELPAPPVVGTQEPIWPYVAGASDGSVVIAATQNISGATSGVGFHNRMPSDLTGWPAWITWPDTVQSGGRYPTMANGTGRVGIIMNTSNGTAVLGNRWRESTNNGVTWASPVNLYGMRTVGTDTFYSYVHADFVYRDNTPLFAFSEFKVEGGFVGDPAIVFWSQATGFVVAVRHDTTKYFRDAINQRFHRDPLGWPSIGLSGNRIVIVYQGFQQETDTRNYNYSDLWMVTSDDNGMTWSQPVRVTNTPSLDERYPSVSKWNAPGQVNMVWSQKSKSGLYAFPGNADTVRASQVFLRLTLTDVKEKRDELASSFRLGQNYPNPFNPATKISYTIPVGSDVSLRVYNVLGQEIATLVSEYRAAGTYEVAFDASTIPSGVYFYTLTAGGFSDRKKMVLLK